MYRGQGMKMTVRTRESCSPATEVAITSTGSGLSSGSAVNSIENRPLASGVTRIPLTLTVASGDVTPATVTVSEATTWSPAGDESSNFNSTVCGTGEGLGAAVEVGPGAVAAAAVAGGVTVGSGVGVNVAVGAGEGVAAAAGAPAAAGVEVDETVATGVAVASSPPHDASRPSHPISPRPAARAHFRREILTVISFFQ